MLADALSAPVWMIALAVIGLVATGYAILALFTSVGEESVASVTEVCPIDSDDFLLGLAGTINAPVQQGGTARLLNDGDEIFPAILEAIGSARHSVNFMVYIWEPGELSDRIFDALTRKAAEGVGVRVLVDALGGIKAPRERIRALEDAGGRWEWFHPVRFGLLTRLHKRNHRRAIIVDGCIGYTGGAAIADKWLGRAQDPDHWRDCMVEVRGGLAANLQSAFTQLWSHVTGEMPVGACFYPTAPGAQRGEHVSSHINVVSSPSNEAHPLRRVFWMSFRCAGRCIYITNPYFVPDDVSRAVLKERASAGVDVRVLVPNELIDVSVIRWASHSYYEELLSAGVRIYEYQPTMIHQKLLVVDDCWSVVGSANLDVRSKELNQENVLGILDHGFAAQIRDTFFRDLEHAREIDLERWRRRPRWRRVPERVSRLFEEQF